MFVPYVKPACSVRMKPEGRSGLFWTTGTPFKTTRLVVKVDAQENH